MAAFTMNEVAHITVVVQRAQELAASGDFEGFNALSPALTREFGERAVESLRRDYELRFKLTELCATNYEAKRQNARSRK
jgi:hypothetical protein